MTNDEVFIVAFGGAKLFKRLNGEYDLRHGTDAERQEAMEWISRFLPGAIPRLESERRQKPFLKGDGHTASL